MSDWQKIVAKARPQLREGREGMRSSGLFASPSPFVPESCQQEEVTRLTRFSLLW